MSALAIPYFLFPLALASALRGLRWHEDMRVLVPLAFGLGPFLFSWLLELLLSLAPGTGMAARALPLLGLLGLLSLCVTERRQRLRWVRQEWSGAPLLLALAVFLVMWLAAGNRMLFSWDPQTNRLIADRIAAEGLVDPVRLIFEPTIQDLVLIHAYHGLRYLLLLATNRLAWAGDIPVPAAWDEIPAIWFLVCTVMLVGGMLSRTPGWRDWRPWAAAALMLGAADFLSWPLSGNTAGSFSAFACAAVFVTSMTAASTNERDPRFPVRWIMVGVALGLMMGAHRTILLLGIVPSCFALAAGALSGRWRVLLWAGAGALTSVVVFCPFGYWLTFHVGDWAAANPVSDALVPYRETWRAAFRPHPWFMSTVQFTSPEKGALIWWGGLIGGIVLVTEAWRSGEWRRQPQAWAFGISLVVMCLLIADIAQLLRLGGVSELIVRATRYRQMVVPMLAYVAVLGFARLLPRPFTGVPPGGSARGRLLIVAGFVGVCLVLANTLDRRLPSGSKKIHERVVTMFGVSDRDSVMDYSPEHAAVIDQLEGRAANGRTYLDWMPLVGLLPGRIANPWMPPGLFGLMDADSAARAWSAADAVELDRMVMRVGRSDMEIYSATGLRLFQSLQVSRQLYDGRFLQLFERRTRLLPASAPVPQTLTPAISALLGVPGQTITRPLDVFTSPLTVPGDYELAVDFSSRGGTLQFAEQRHDRRQRVFRLKSWQPYIAGPQRIRFQVRAGDAVNFRLGLRGTRHPVTISSIVLSRADSTEDSTLASISGVRRGGSE